MGYIQLTKKKVGKTESIVIRIFPPTLKMLRDLFPGKPNESASQYFYRLAGELRRLKYLENENR